MDFIRIIEHVEDVNLLNIGWNQRFLDSVKRDFRLRHADAVLYVNRAKDRFRVVANFYGLAVLILPPTDKAARLSLYLEVSQFLRRFSSDSDTSLFVDSEIKRIKYKIKRSKLASVAKKNRRSR